MRTRTTLLLGAALAALVAAYLFTNFRTFQKARQEYFARRLFDFNPADVTTLSIRQQGADAIEAARQNGGWQLTGPRSGIPANGPLWEQLAQAVAATMNERPIAEKGADLAPFDLKTPKLTVEVGPASGKARRIDFGALDPMQHHRYAQLDGGGVFLVRAELYSALNRSLLDLRDRRIFTNLAGGLTRVDYERLPAKTEAGAKLDESVKQAAAAIHETYAKSATGEWRMTAPVEARGRQDLLEKLEAALVELTGREYVDAPESLGDYGLSTPFAQITAHGKEGAPQTLLLGWLKSGEESSGMYVKRADLKSVAVIDGGFMTKLPMEPEFFREKRLFTGEIKHVKSLKYHDANGGFTLQNTPGGWRLSEPAADETDQKAASEYFTWIKVAEGTSLPAGAAVPAVGSPTLSIEFQHDDGRPPSKIEVGRPVPGGEKIMMPARQDFGGVTMISFETFRTLQANAFQFQAKNLFAFVRGLVEEIEITLDGKKYRFAQAGGRWSVVEPTGATIESQADVTGFLDALATARVTGIADPAPGAEVQGVDAPVLAVSAKLGGPNPGVYGPVRVGNLKAPQSRDRFVTIGGHPGLYYVDQGLVDIARKQLGGVRVP